MSVQNEIVQLQAKRLKFRRAGLVCGIAAATVGFWGGVAGQILGGLTFLFWLALLICGFVFRSVAVNARESAKFLEMQLAAQGLTPDLSPLNNKVAVDPAVVGAAWNSTATEPAKPAAAKPKASTDSAKAAQTSEADTVSEANIESRLAKARRNKN